MELIKNYAENIKNNVIVSIATLLLSIVYIDVSLAGHKEAPGVALDPAADVADVYAFRSWENPENLVLIMNVYPGQEPGDGPIYFNFDDSVIYRIHIDNDMDSRADDIVYEVRFESEHRPVFGELTFAEPYVGHPNIQSVPELQGITALDGSGSEGITFRQTYSVTEIREKKRRMLFDNQTLVAVPSNIGSTTMPNYESLAAQGIYKDNGFAMRVFAGQRGDTFYSDSGALYDSADLRRFPPVLTEEEENNDSINPFGVNRNSGANISSIALEIPIQRITKDGKSANDTSYPYIGVYASASRLAGLIKSKRNVFLPFEESDWRDKRWQYAKERQISRMGNPMVNTLIIDTPYKDTFNQSKPTKDVHFEKFFSSPSLTRPPASEIFGIPVPPPPRLDLISLFLQYPNQNLSEDGCDYTCADLLRLNVSIEPTVPEEQKRMGKLGGDPAGFPNGRRPNDDVTDYVVRSIGGPVLIAIHVGDGVNFANGVVGAGFSDGSGYGEMPGNKLDVTENGIVKEFPFLPTPHDGKNHNHHN